MSHSANRAPVNHSPSSYTKKQIDILDSAETTRQIREQNTAAQVIKMHTRKTTKRGIFVVYVILFAKKASTLISVSELQ